jgi:phage tail-like protein
MAPRLLAAQATSATEVRLAFDLQVTMPATATITFASRSAPAVPLASASLTSAGSTISVTVTPPMTPDATYEVVVAGVLDTADQPVRAPFDRAVFTGFHPQRPAARRFDLLAMLPRHARRDDVSGDLARFVACLQEVTDYLLAGIDRWTDLLDLERTPEWMLDLMLEDLGNPFPFALDELGKRRLSASLVDMYELKGTAVGVERAIRFFLGIESKVVAFATEALTLGESYLGFDWVLGPSNSFARYAFDIEVARVLTDEERSQLRTLVGFLRPAHTHFVSLVEPLPVTEPDHWVLGQSELDTEVRLHS